MSKPNCRGPPQRHSSSSTNLASCVVATIFLIFVAIILLILFFTLFKPKDLTLTVNAVQLPAFALAAANATVSFSLVEYITVRNPNRRAAFTHYDSTMQLLYLNSQIGFMFVPAGKINADSSEHMVARFSVGSFPIGGSGVGVSAAGGGVGMSSLEIESRMEMVGKVRVLGFFNHRVETRLDCRVSIRVSDGSVIGFRC